MPSHHRIALGSLLGLTLILAGCSSSTGPVGSLNDPAATAAQAAAIDSALNAPAIASFQALGGHLHLAPPVNRAVGALGALSLAGASQDRYVALAGQAHQRSPLPPVRHRARGGRAVPALGAGGLRRSAR
jgi:hypothetical protein